jgi:cytochrome c oxidase subunit 1
MYNEWMAKAAAIIVFCGFNLTFFPQFILGYLGMPRRYHAYPDEMQVLNVLSTAGASILAIGLVLPAIYLTYSWFYGPLASGNPWSAKGLEWETDSPPPTVNFEETPIVAAPAYAYSREEAHVV